MGFGNGYGRRTTRGGKSYNNSMTAHVWNAQSEERGQSSNGNFYFSGRALYSYGTHFVVGYIMPDGVAFLNGDSYSVSTSQHQGDARAAVKDRRSVSVAGLTNLAGDWKLLPRLAQFLEAVASRGVTAAERKEMQANVRKALFDFADELTAEIYAPGAERWTWDSEAGKSIRHAGDMEAGAYLARIVGLPAASWDKAKREAARAKAAADKRAAIKATSEAERRALWLADMSDRAWRDWLARMGTEYSNRQFVETGKELKRARSLMLKATRGKLASAKRLATVRDRIKRIAAEAERFDAMRQPRLNRESIKRSAETLRGFRDSPPHADSVTWHYFRNIADAAANLAKRGRLAGLMASAERLASEAKAACDAIEAESARLNRLERERQALAIEERKALWLAGERVGAIRFDAESGGAALRIVGDTLETSHGASVPLEHAIKAFRFIKLCRERGEAFHRNGRTIRVGHFQVDSISPTGDFVAGCHNFAWPEVERVARIAGVFDCAPSAEAVEPSGLAA